MNAQASSIQMHTSSVYVPNVIRSNALTSNRNHSIKYQRNGSFTDQKEFPSHSPTSSLNEVQVENLLQNE